MFLTKITSDLSGYEIVNVLGDSFTSRVLNNNARFNVCLGTLKGPAMKKNSYDVLNNTSK